MNVYLIVLASVVLTAFAQIMLKAGMSAPPVQRAVGEGTILNLVVTIAQTPAIAVGFFLYGASVLLWLMVLSRLEVSRAYPFVGLGIVITMGFGYLLLGEPLNLAKVTGTVLVATGVYMVASA